MFPYFVTFTFLSFFVVFPVISACFAMLCWCAPLVFSFICFHRTDDFQSTELGQFELKIAAYQDNPFKQSLKLNRETTPTRPQGLLWYSNPNGRLSRDVIIFQSQKLPILLKF